MSEDLLVDGYDYNPHTCMVEVPYNDYWDMKDKCKENKQLKSQLQQKENIIKEVREYLKFLKEHYEELRTNPVEDSYFINDMLRQMFIQSIENYLLGIEEILDKVDKE